MPIDIGSTTPKTAAVATAASMALPPFMRMRTPARVASGWLEATMPFLATTENSGDIIASRWLEAGEPGEISRFGSSQIP